jgi:hypothetical protein
MCRALVCARLHTRHVTCALHPWFTHAPPQEAQRAAAAQEVKQQKLEGVPRALRRLYE